MSVDAHRSAETLLTEGELLERRGQETDALERFLLAAESEATAFLHIPVARPKTRALIAISAVSLFLRAKAYEQAIRHAHLYLSDGQIASLAQDRLEDLLEEARWAQAAQSISYTLGEDAFVVSMRGSETNAGLARIDTVALKLQQIEKYVHRVCEYVVGLPFRAKGSVPQAIQNICHVMVTEPSYGSFQFGVRFMTDQRPQQLSHFPEPPAFEVVSPAQVSQAFFGILESVTTIEPGAIKDQIQDEQYREVLVKLVRNLVPDGQNIHEIEIRRVAGDEPASALLTPHVGRAIEQYLSLGRKRTIRESVRTGVLRALDLDRGWIELGEEGAKDHQRCYIEEHKVFDDVVGPLVNRRVRVPGYMKGRQFILIDIELASDVGSRTSEGTEQS